MPPFQGRAPWTFPATFDKTTDTFPSFAQVPRLTALAFIIGPIPQNSEELGGPSQAVCGFTLITHIIDLYYVCPYSIPLYMVYMSEIYVCMYVILYIYVYFRFPWPLVKKRTSPSKTKLLKHLWDEKPYEKIPGF